MIRPERRTTRRGDLPREASLAQVDEKLLQTLFGRAASWKTARRVVAKVEHHAGELFPRVGFIVTNLTVPSRAVVRFYNKRGTSERWIKEGKQAVKMTRVSYHRFRSNAGRLWLTASAYNLG